MQQNLAAAKSCRKKCQKFSVEDIKPIIEMETPPTRTVAYNQETNAPVAQVTSAWPALSTANIDGAEPQQGRNTTTQGNIDKDMEKEKF